VWLPLHQEQWVPTWRIAIDFDLRDAAAIRLR
jgi:hypothetical protein